MSLLHIYPLICGFFLQVTLELNGWCVISCMVDANVESVQHPTTQRSNQSDGSISVLVFSKYILHNEHI